MTYLDRFAMPLTAIRTLIKTCYRATQTDTFELLALIENKATRDMQFCAKVASLFDPATLSTTHMRDVLACFGDYWDSSELSYRNAVNTLDSVFYHVIKLNDWGVLIDDHHRTNKMHLIDAIRRSTGMSSVPLNLMERVTLPLASAERVASEFFNYDHGDLTGLDTVIHLYSSSASDFTLAFGVDISEGYTIVHFK
ncbi:hypothetical protein QTV44_002476 [Vibrio vulnificus]|nr:hypothetical protein [Vibrio vulnificus]